VTPRTIEPADASALPDPHSLNSRHREKVVEHLLVGELLREMWCLHCTDVDVLRPEVDAAGYDVVFSHKRIIRHVQIKASLLGGRTQEQSVSEALAVHQSACVVWAVVDQELRFRHFLWFGGAPGEPLPDVTGFKRAKQTRANAKGVKAARRQTRVIRRNQFELVPTVRDLVSKLFGKEYQ